MRLFIFLAALMFPAAAQAHTINNCACDPDCYTKEVEHLRCNDRHASFKSKGLPNTDHRLMLGIEASNQQFPSIHNYEFRVPRNPQFQQTPTPTTAGAIGVAVNGVPLFNPDTQGPGGPGGKPVSALDAGELDECGGHAGRGDDYHYHMAPKCLIEELGAEKIEHKKNPVGFAMDGYPILALGWFDDANTVEDMLDKCRGMKDDQGAYFYNVKSGPKWDILNCFHGKPQKFARDWWRERKDKNNREIVGLPIKFKIENYQTLTQGEDVCHAMDGVLSNEQLLRTSGTAQRVGRKSGTIFHCNTQCYGLFFEAEKKPQFRGRVLYYDLVTKDCPSTFDLAGLKPFTGYEGPPQKYKGPPKTGGKGPKPGKNNRPPRDGDRPPRPDGERPPPRQ